MSASPYLLLSISERSRPRLGEWQATLRRYNVAVRGVPDPAPRTDASVPIDAEGRLRGAGQSSILGVLWESAEPVLPGTTTPAPRAHLQAVEHLSRALLFSLRGGALAEDVYEGQARATSTFATARRRAGGTRASAWTSLPRIAQGVAASVGWLCRARARCRAKARITYS